MKVLRDFISVIDLQTVVVLLLAVGTTYLCRRYGIYADIPTGLIGLAVVFPIVFSINTAYRRREEALRYFSGLKALAVSLYFAHRDWPGAGNNQEHSDRLRQLIERLLVAVNNYLSPKGRSAERLEIVLEVFSELSHSHEELRQTSASPADISRANQYLAKMLGEFERMRNVANYRTPVSLRAYSSIFLNLFPIAFGPYFATLSQKSTAFPEVGYMVAGLYSLVLVTLDNIQEDLEDPFDGVGTDDVVLDVFEQYRSSMNR